MVYLNKESGFSLYHVLFVLGVLIICISLQAAILKTLQAPFTYDSISTQQFFYFIQRDVIEASDITMKNHQLMLHSLNGDKITYEQYGSLVRRQVNNQGHEIYLRDISNLSISPLPYGFVIRITTQKGGSYEKKIRYYP